jgi:lipopolysaccharide/colanic/teichoic acid biosynthesis glycosyltransferase
VNVLVWVLVVLASVIIEAELIAWCRPLQRALIKRAAAPLPRQHRERYIEEWYRELDEIPDGPVTRLCWVLLLLLRRGSLARALGASRSVVGFTGALKRLGDIVLAAVGLLILFPLMLGLAMLVKLEDGGPPIFRQTRIGLDGKPFTMLKFRTTVKNAEAIRTEVRELSESHGVLLEVPEHYLISSSGKLLRDFSLDELPNLFNVLRGSMSLVGPRPHLMNESAPDANEKVSVKPGLTGAWQISGRSNEDARRLDLEYAKRWSLWLDIKIMAKTLIAVLRKRA